MKLCTQSERKTFQRQIALNLEHKDLLISILVKIFLLIQRIEKNVVGWLGRYLDIIQVATQLFEELKTVPQIEDNLNLSHKFTENGERRSPSTLFTNPQTSPIHVKGHVGFLKTLDKR